MTWAAHAYPVPMHQSQHSQCCTCIGTANCPKERSSLCNRLAPAKLDMVCTSNAINPSCWSRSTTPALPLLCLITFALHSSAHQGPGRGLTSVLQPKTAILIAGNCLPTAEEFCNGMKSAMRPQIKGMNISLRLPL